MNEGYTFNGFQIPEHMLGGLERYIRDRIKPGGFLQAVISNDLRAAVERADDCNRANLPAYVGYLYNEAPAACWGSTEAMVRWLDRGEEQA